MKVVSRSQVGLLTCLCRIGAFPGLIPSGYRADRQLHETYSSGYCTGLSPVSPPPHSGGIYLRLGHSQDEAKVAILEEIVLGQKKGNFGGINGDYWKRRNRNKDLRKPFI